MTNRLYFPQLISGTHQSWADLGTLKKSRAKYQNIHQYLNSRLPGAEAKRFTVQKPHPLSEYSLPIISLKK